MPGVEFKPRALIKGSAYVGYRRFTPSAADVLPEFSGLVGAARTVLHAARLDHVRRELRAGPDLLLRRGAALLRQTWIGVSVRRRWAAVSTRWPLADRHALRLPALVAAAGRRSGSRSTHRHHLELRGKPRLPHRQWARRLRRVYWERESTTRSLRDYDNLRFGTRLLTDSESCRRQHRSRQSRRKALWGGIVLLAALPCARTASRRSPRRLRDRRTGRAHHPGVRPGGSRRQVRRRDRRHLQLSADRTRQGRRPDAARFEGSSRRSWPTATSRTRRSPSRSSSTAASGCS
jgi:hypothetical protein